MLESLLFIFVGALIGWNFPQPFWAKMFQSYVQEKWAAFKAKK